MITQTMDRKNFSLFEKPVEKGFYIEGINFDDCIKQLSEWCAEHKDKWVYYYDCGAGIKKSIPVSRHIFEISIYDKKPACIVMSNLYQEGCEGKCELDDMTDVEKSALLKKQMLAFYMMFSCNN